MGIIKQLSAHEAQKIAAGEVIERPVSIVKELVENAIDAHATQVSIYIEDGGKKLIRVLDNGCGMDNSDAQLCFGKHATSKISSFDQLEKINTHGFRGEALASIAAISSIRLITAQEGKTGIQITVKENMVQDYSEVAHTQGTDIYIQNMFYNVPARLKFLKSKETEWRQIQQLIRSFCFAYPTIHFKLLSEERLVYNCPPVQSLINRSTQLHDSSISHAMLAVETQKTERSVSMTGIISNPHIFRFDRSDIFFFVNKRWIKNQKLASALIKGYQNVLPSGRFPLSVITITIDPAQVDINIHPRKEEVLFLHPRVVEIAIQDMVTKGLENNAAIATPRKVFPQHTIPSFTPQPFSVLASPTSYPSFGTKDHTDFRQPTATILPVTHQSLTLDPEVIAHDQTSTSLNDLEYRLIGQYAHTYLLLEQSDGLWLIDQHAAHERILYELFENRFQAMETITLLFPQIITLSNEDMSCVLPHLHIFHNHGIHIEPFGLDQLIIQATPAHLKNINVHELVYTVAGWIKELDTVENNEFVIALHKKLRAQMACKAAVKAGDQLSHEQMHQLIRDLHKTNNRFSCPHGRPTTWIISLYDIEKKFKRKA